VIATGFMPNSVFETFAEICRYFSFLFLIFQIFVLIDFAYVWNSNWVEKEMFKPIIAISLGLYLVSYILAGFFVPWFAGTDGQCGTERFFIGFTYALTLVVTGISITEKLAPHGALLPSAVLTAYCTFLLYSALASDPQPQCNSTLMHQSSKTLQLVISMLLAAFSIVKAAWDMSSANLFGAQADEVLVFSFFFILPYVCWRLMHFCFFFCQ
jgi:hypothetical protein